MSSAVVPSALSATPPAPTPAATAAAGGGDAGEGLRLSFSRVESYRTCPLKFRFGYVDKLPAQPSPTLSWGSSIHTAIEAWWDAKLSVAPPVEVLLRALYDGWDDTGFAGMPRDEKLRWYAEAQEVLRRHHARHAPTYAPAVASEAWFEVDLGEGIELVGSIDHVCRTASGGIGIVDWKTNKRAKTRAQVRSSLQLAVYALAARELWGVDPDFVALEFVVPGLRVEVPRSELDVEGAVAAIRAVAADIRAGRFDPTPSRLCDWCDWRSACPAFAGDGPDVAGTAVVELQRLRRKAARDAARIAELEAIVAERLGPDVIVEA